MLLLFLSVLLSVVTCAPTLNLDPFVGSIPGAHSVPDYETVPMFTDSSATPTESYQQFLYPISTDDNVVVHKYILENPRSTFSFKPPIGLCGNLSHVRDSAQHYNCSTAFNAGFFDMKAGFCIGYLISDGKIFNSGGFSGAFFGITKDFNYVMGYVTQQMLESQMFLHGVQGIVYLVRNGQVYVNESIKQEGTSPAFVNQLAARIAIGHDADGRLVILQVDGYSPIRYGVDLHTFAEICKSFELVNAVNIDGGGSISFLYQGSLKNSCSDDCPEFSEGRRCSIPFGGSKCLRRVSSFICIK
ncbi:hypothetical protein RCL1_004330 [Eukaryota sp. TZLM3-RCL]